MVRAVRKKLIQLCLVIRLKVECLVCGEAVVLNTPCRLLLYVHCTCIQRELSERNLHVYYLVDTFSTRTSTPVCASVVRILLTV